MVKINNCRRQCALMQFVVRICKWSSLSLRNARKQTCAMFGKGMVHLQFCMDLNVMCMFKLERKYFGCIVLHNLDRVKVAVNFSVDAVVFNEV